jgi:hypothetical protein
MNARIGMIEFESASSERKIIYLICKCQCGKTATRAIPCPVDLAGTPPGTFIGVNEFGRLEAEA